MELSEVKKLKNEDYRQQVVDEYIATNKSLYNKEPDKIIEMFMNQMIINFEQYLNQTEPDTTLKGADMWAVLHELYLEAQCVLEVMKERE